MYYRKYAGYYYVNLSQYSSEERLKKIDLLEQYGGEVSINPQTNLYGVSWNSDYAIENCIGIPHDYVDLVGRFGKN